MTGAITAIWLRRTGDDVEVLFERDGEWFLAITELVDGSFSHIIEEAGIAKAPKDRLS